jgi:hypothetical protein
MHPLIRVNLLNAIHLIVGGRSRRVLTTKRVIRIVLHSPYIYLFLIIEDNWLVKFEWFSAIFLSTIWLESRFEVIFKYCCSRIALGERETCFNLLHFFQLLENSFWSSIWSEFASKCHSWYTMLKHNYGWRSIIFFF